MALTPTHPSSTGPLIGVDLSPKMLSKARARAGLYSELVEGDVVGFLRAREGAGCDLIFLADVVVYIGDLAPLLSSCAAAAGPVSEERLIVAFSAEALVCDFRPSSGSSMKGKEFMLQSSGRYAHSEAYIRATAEEAGFEVLRLVTAGIREQAGNPVQGHLVVLGSGAPDGRQ